MRASLRRMRLDPSAGIRRSRPLWSGPTPAVKQNDDRSPAGWRHGDVGGRAADMRAEAGDRGEGRADILRKGPFGTAQGDQVASVLRSNPQHRVGADLRRPCNRYRGYHRFNHGISAAWRDAELCRINRHAE